MCAVLFTPNLLLRSGQLHPEVLPVLVHQQQHVPAPIATPAKLPNRKEVENFTSLQTPSPYRVFPVDW